jgi:hypothetical protein
LKRPFRNGTDFSSNLLQAKSCGATAMTPHEEALRPMDGATS